MYGRARPHTAVSTLTHTGLALLAPQVKLCSLRDSSNCASPEGIYSLEGRSQSLGLAHGGAGLGERVMDSAARQAQDACLPLPQGHCHGKQSPSLEQASFCR